MPSLNIFQWLRYGPWLAQVVVTRRCNLKCGYCTEYDRTSEPVPYDELALRLAKLAELRAWAVCLTGGEPTMHPRLPDLVAEMKRLGFKRRMMITNGWRLTPALIDALNGAGLTDMQISVDGVNPTKVTAKTLKPLRKKLELLAEKATFQVVMSGVIGSAPAEEALEVVDFAKAHGFTPRILLVHDENGQSRLSREELIVYDEAKRRIGDRANEAFGYRGKMIESGEAPFKCRSGSRYLYVDEFGAVHWCYQTRDMFLEGPARLHLRRPSGAVRRAEKLQYALHHRLRANRLRHGRVALPVGPRRRASCGDCFIRAPPPSGCRPLHHAAHGSPPPRRGGGCPALTRT